LLYKYWGGLYTIRIEQRHPKHCRALSKTGR